MNCNPTGAKAMTPAEVKQHLTDVHHITEHKGKRSGIQFLDGEGFYSNTFEWTFQAAEVGEVKLVQVTSGPK